MTTSKTPRARITGTLHLPAYYASLPAPTPTPKGWGDLEATGLSTLSPEARYDFAAFNEAQAAQPQPSAKDYAAHWREMQALVAAEGE